MARGPRRYVLQGILLSICTLVFILALADSSNWFILKLLGTFVAAGGTIASFVKARAIARAEGRTSPGD